MCRKGKNSCNAMKKDSNNKHMMSSEKMKHCYSEISKWLFECFKILNDASVRSNVIEWADELCSCKRRHMLVSLRKLKDVSLRMGIASLKKRSELVIQLWNYDKSNSNENVIVSNEIVLTNRLLCNILLSDFLKTMSKGPNKSKSAKLGHRMIFL